MQVEWKKQYMKKGKGKVRDMARKGMSKSKSKETREKNGAKYGNTTELRTRYKEKGKATKRNSHVRIQAM